MTVYIGVDFHARQQTISYLTTEDGEIRRLQLDHGRADEVRRFYRQFAGQRVVVGFESSGRAAWFEELLEELGCEIWIGHATAIRLFARRRQKNDRRDGELTLRLQRLRTQDGIAPLRGLCLANTLERPERFATPRKVTAYVGFDPVEDSSGQRRRIGSISKQGSRLLRFLLVEAGQIAVRKDEELARVYKRVLVRRGRAQGQGGVGRRVLVRAVLLPRE